MWERGFHGLPFTDRAMYGAPVAKAMRDDLTDWAEDEPEEEKPAETRDEQYIGCTFCYRVVTGADWTCPTKYKREEIRFFFGETSKEERTHGTDHLITFATDMPPTFEKPASTQFNENGPPSVKVFSNAVEVKSARRWAMPSNKRPPWQASQKGWAHRHRVKLPPLTQQIKTGSIAQHNELGVVFVYSWPVLARDGGPWSNRREPAPAAPVRELPAPNRPRRWEGGGFSCTLIIDPIIRGRQRPRHEGWIRQSDEFVCGMCFAIKLRVQIGDQARGLCSDCATEPSPWNSAATAHVKLKSTICKWAPEPLDEWKSTRGERPTPTILAGQWSPLTTRTGHVRAMGSMLEIGPQLEDKHGGQSGVNPWRPDMSKIREAQSLKAIHNPDKRAKNKLVSRRPQAEVLERFLKALRDHDPRAVIILDEQIGGAQAQRAAFAYQGDPRVCPVDQHLFYPARANQVYCGRAHKDQAYRERKALRDGFHVAPIYEGSFSLPDDCRCTAPTADQDTQPEGGPCQQPTDPA
jgi:hypothetical protein